MDIKKFVNMFCLILGVSVIIFGIIVLVGRMNGVDSARGIIPIFLGVIVVLWSGVSMIRNLKK